MGEILQFGQDVSCVSKHAGCTIHN